MLLFIFSHGFIYVLDFRIKEGFVSEKDPYF